jgi:DNA-binding transcriptional MerR regulator
MSGYTAGEVSKLTGIPYARLDYWARSGFLRPSVSGGNGKGSKRLYAFRDIVALRTARELRIWVLGCKNCVKSCGTYADLRGWKIRSRS